jgi:hypothetical protein
MHKHGLTGSPTWVSCVSAWQRCNNPNLECYPQYGGAGVKVDWPTVGDMVIGVVAAIGLRTNKKLSLDRFPDPNGPYSATNIRWATAAQQAANLRRGLKFLEQDGVLMTAKDWAEIGAVSVDTIRQRAKRGKPLVDSDKMKNCFLA